MNESDIFVGCLYSCGQFYVKVSGKRIGAVIGLISSNITVNFNDEYITWSAPNEIPFNILSPIPVGQLTFLWNQRSDGAIFLGNELETPEPSVTSYDLGYNIFISERAGHWVIEGRETSFRYIHELQKIYFEITHNELPTFIFTPYISDLNL